jgi:Rrf2 family transcriptional regulator, cysteine metabolism repressor
MKLTTKSEYALVALIYIARHEQSKFISIHDICGLYDLPQKYTEQLLTTLKSKHVIVTKRGKMGGYGLARPAGTITVAEIVRLFDGPLAPLNSASIYYYSPTILEKERKIHAVFKKIRDYTSTLLEHTTLADVI